MALQIRRIEEQDFEHLVELFQALASFNKTPEKMMNTVELMNSEKDLINGFLAVSEGETIMGYVTWFYTYHTWVGKCAHMDDLFVKEKFRNQGVGKKLINSVIEEIKKEKCHQLRWQVAEWNHNGIDFYKSLGATVDSTEWNCQLELK